MLDTRYQILEFSPIPRCQVCGEPIATPYSVTVVHIDYILILFVEAP